LPGLLKSAACGSANCDSAHCPPKPRAHSHRDMRPQFRPPQPAPRRDHPRRRIRYHCRAGTSFAMYWTRHRHRTTGKTRASWRKHDGSTVPIVLCIGRVPVELGRRRESQPKARAGQHEYGGPGQPKSGKGTVDRIWKTVRIKKATEANSNFPWEGAPGRAASCPGNQFHSLLDRVVFSFMNSVRECR